MLSQGKSLLSLVAGHLVWNQLKYSQSFQDLEQVLLEFDERIPLIKDAAQVNYMCDIVEFMSNDLSTALVPSSVTYAVMWLFFVSCITIFTGEHGRVELPAPNSAVKMCCQLNPPVCYLYAAKLYSFDLYHT